MNLYDLKEKIIAHRGIFNNEDIPENSIGAFLLAIKNSVPIELDVQLSSDNRLFVFHDDNMKRMTKLDKDIRNTPSNIIKKLKLLNTNYTVPEFSEVLKLVDGRVLLDIEIKNTEKVDLIIKGVLEELKDYNGKFLIKSFNPIIVRRIKNKKPDILTGYLINSKYENFIYNILLKSKLMIKYTKCNFIAINKNLLRTKKYQILKKKYRTFIWTVKTKNEIDTIKDVTYICNNLDDEFLHHTLRNCEIK